MARKSRQQIRRTSEGQKVELKGWICPECGSYNDGWMHICDTCSYDPAVQIRKNRAAAVRRRILSGLRVVLFLVIACALALGCYYLGRSIHDGFASSEIVGRFRDNSQLRGNTWSPDPQVFPARANAVGSRLLGIGGTFTERLSAAAEKLSGQVRTELQARTEALSLNSLSVRQSADNRINAAVIMARMAFLQVRQRAVYFYESFVNSLSNFH